VKENVLTGAYNERGYVIQKDMIDVYAAGNHHYYAQDYVSPRDGMGIDEIAECCTDKIKEMIADPLLWERIRENLDTTLKDGGIKYDESVEPKAVAGMTGDFWNDDER